MRRVVCLCAVVLPAMPGHAAGAAIMLTGRGMQIYTCSAMDSPNVADKRPASPSDRVYAWHLKAPDADLFDAHGHHAGHHGAGPSWHADDGSSVTGAKVAEGASPAPGAIPWLILRATSNSGSGVFTGVTYVVRSQTEGGVAPPAGCDSAHAGAELRVRYTALYTFM